MADEVKQTEAELDAQIEKEINEKMVADVAAIINPPPAPVEKPEDKPPPAEKAEEVENKPEGEQVEKEADKLADLNLPRRLLQAVKRNQLTDDEVLALGDKAVPVLTKLADRLDAVSAQLGEIGRQKKQELSKVQKEQPKDVPTLKFDDATLGDNPALKEVQDKLNAAADEINRLNKEQLAIQAQARQQEIVERDRKIDSFFDKVVTDYPEFGKTSALTTAELTNRVNVWEVADNIQIGALMKGEKIPLEEALNQAFYRYEGKNPRKVKEKLLDEVKKREEQLIHRPTAKHGKEAPPSKNSQAVKAVDAILNRGKTGWEK